MSMKPRAMRDAFLEKLYQEMARDEKIFFVSADFGSPVLDKIRADFGDRFVNVGIAEQNLINVSAGLALEGYKVFAYAIAPFITMRCFEQIRVSLALLSQVRPMNVNLIGVGAGYSYVVSGPTHQCYEDLTIMRALPTVQVMSPSDHVVAESMFEHCAANVGPKYLRFDAQVLPVIYENGAPDLQRGFHVHREGDALCLLATGFMAHTALAAAVELAKAGIEVGVIDLYAVSNFDEVALQRVLDGYAGVVTLEEGFRARGGVDSMLFDFLGRTGSATRMFNIGVEPGYRFELGSRAELHEQVSIGVHAVVTQVRDFAGILGMSRKSGFGDYSLPSKLRPISEFFS